jgi:multiple antibiotic resistance protein
MPILAGPGTTVNAMNHVTNSSYTHITIVILIFGLIVLLTYFALSLSELIVKKLGSNLISVIGKLMGLILAVMGTGMFTEGLKLTFNLN